MTFFTIFCYFFVQNDYLCANIDYAQFEYTIVLLNFTEVIGNYLI